MDACKKIAVIVAGGKGVRMGSTTPKQFLPLYGKPVLYYSLEAFRDTFPDIEIVLVLPEEHLSFGRRIQEAAEYPFLTVTTGGGTRFHSVKNGLQKVKEPSVVFVHDGARPLLSPALIRRCYQQALEKGSAVPAVPVKESMRITGEEGSKAVDRSRFRLIQTPQTFRSEILLPAFEQAYDPLFTDEATVVESFGHPVHLTEGEEQNIKITGPADLLLAEKLLETLSAATDGPS